MQILFMILLMLASLFLILLILVQRGKGGGLAGAFGGMGGQSAFGSKAGDVFTRATIIAATGWILLCVLAIVMLGQGEKRFDEDLGAGAGPAERQLLEEAPDATGGTTPAAAAPGSQATGDDAGATSEGQPAGSGAEGESSDSP